MPNPKKVSSYSLQERIAARYRFALDLGTQEEDLYAGWNQRFQRSLRLFYGHYYNALTACKDKNVQGSLGHVSAALLSLGAGFKTLDYGTETAMAVLKASDAIKDFSEQAPDPKQAPMFCNKLIRLTGPALKDMVGQAKTESLIPVIDALLKILQGLMVSLKAVGAKVPLPLVHKAENAMVEFEFFHRHPELDTERVA